MTKTKLRSKKKTSLDPRPPSIHPADQLIYRDGNEEQVTRLVGTETYNNAVAEVKYEIWVTGWGRVRLRVCCAPPRFCLSHDTHLTAPVSLEALGRIMADARRVLSDYLEEQST